MAQHSEKTEKNMEMEGIEEQLKGVLLHNSMVGYCAPLKTSTQTELPPLLPANWTCTFDCAGAMKGRIQWDGD
jgi:hypothetical protein